MDFPGAFYIGSPRRYIQQPGETPGFGPAVNPYSLPTGVPDDMAHMPAAIFARPMFQQHTPPDCDQMNAFMYAPNPALPVFLRPGNRAAMTVHTATGGQPEGLRMLVISPGRYNAAALTRHTARDTRLLPGRSGRPSRRYVPGIPIGS